MVVPISTLDHRAALHRVFLLHAAAYPSGGGSGDLEIALRARELRESP